ncbi:efflux RND transporter periplasmic adaptor subunit [Magnetospirillum sp. 15-1]|uniref:efflux RND transporter periplasmic adaptor subunit n=1 Tax=Magnetospirillum sp. 15-1 TaxID=1979370 RepID=UPI000BBBB5A3|nr:efflux RND transporter periplasmic adaptor subunit [Magnetospirillum sp. 15-1]
MSFDAPESGSKAVRRLTLRGQVVMLGAGAAVAALLLLALPSLGRHTEAESASAPALPPGTFRATEAQWAALTIEPVRHAVFRPIEETDGRIAYNEDGITPVFSPYSGRVTRVFVRAGDTVRAGDPLLAVDAGEFVQGQNDLIAATSQTGTARAQLTLAEVAERRARDLKEAGGGSLKDWQQAQSDLASARGNLRTAEIALAAARNRLSILGKSDKEIAAIEHAADSHRMGAEAIVRAPIGGTVVSRQVGVGQYISNASSGGANPVFSIGDLSSVWLVANVREADAPRIRGDEPIEVGVLALPGRTFSARLSYVAAAIDAQTRRLPVRAVIDNSDGALKPEMFARFRILTGEERAATAVPQEAVIFEGDEARVWVAGESRVLGLKAIRPGRSADGLVEVVEGLGPDDRVVTAGALFIDRAGKGG